jgi:predicted PurR-regulated permease PerM
MGLLILVLSGLFAYQIVFLLSAKLLSEHQDIKTQDDHHSARTRAGTILGVSLFVLMSAALAATHYALRDSANIRELLIRLSDIVVSAKTALPPFLADRIPAQEAMFSEAGAWLKAHAGVLGGYGMMTLKGIGLALLGLLLGTLVAISEAKQEVTVNPASRLLIDQLTSLKEFFWHVAAAQVKISAINTACTALYLYVILPAFGIELGFRTALISITFIVGLLPVVGNLVANTVMTVFSLDQSIYVAAASLGYLMLIHKLEYIWSGRIIGTKVNAKVWELLVAMIVLEHIFGVPGMVMAPIFYSWMKSEWRHWDNANSRQRDISKL